MSRFRGTLIEACCGALASHLTDDRCAGHGDECPDIVIQRRADGGLGLPIHDGGSSYIEINRCPWCGAPDGQAHLAQEVAG